MLLCHLKEECLFLPWMALHKNNQIVGLEIGSNSLKLLKINSSTTPKKIENFSIASLPPDAIVKGEIKDYAAVAQVLKNMVKQAGITTKEFALSIPRSSTVIKNITIDSRLSEDEIESRAWIEAKNHFPELVGDIFLDFSILGPAAQDASQLELVLVACRKDQLKPYMDVLHMAGLNPAIIDVNNYALERALSLIANETASSTIALLNLDFTLSTLIVVHENKLIYAHDEAFDGNRLLKQVREFPKDSPNYVDLLKDSLSAHLRHTIHFFYSSRPNINIDKIILSGDCVTLSSMDLVVHQVTGIETQLANPFVDMTPSSMVNANELKQNAPALMLCCGLALSTVK